MFCFLEISEMREGIGLLQKCMQCKNVQMGLGKSKREWTALFYIIWTNNLWKNENIYYRAFQHFLCSSTMLGKGRSSPWWNHFQIVNGDFSSGAMYPLQQAGQKRQGWMLLRSTTPVSLPKYLTKFSSSERTASWLTLTWAGCKKLMFPHDTLKKW